MNPGKGFGNLAGFVGLDRANKVPLDALSAGECLHFIQSFLQVVLAKRDLAGFESGLQILRRAGLAYRQKAHAAGLPASLQCCFLYASGYAPDVVCYAAHNVSLPLLD